MTLSAVRAISEVSHQRSRSTGKERDAESGNDYFGARYYASNMGRFLSPDWSDEEDSVPYADLENPQTLNLYGYVTNNPLRLYDPAGHAGVCDLVPCPTMEEVDAGIAYLDTAATEAGTISVGTVVGVVGFVGSQIFAPAQLNNDPAEQRYIRMMAQRGNRNVRHTRFADLSDDELQAIIDDKTGKYSQKDKEDAIATLKGRRERNKEKRGNKTQKKEKVKNDPASVRAREKANAVPAPIPEPPPPPPPPPPDKYGDG